MQHLAADEENDIVGALNADRVLQRQAKGKDPKCCGALVDRPIDSRFAALTTMQRNAAKQLGICIRTMVSSPVRALVKEMSCKDK